jgi:HEPN domain-containing protein
VCQLYLKYYIFLKIAAFDKTHGISELLDGLALAYKKKPEVDAIKKKYFEEISNLEEAYITARYLPAEFNDIQVEKMKEFQEYLIKFLEKLQ